MTIILRRGESGEYFPPFSSGWNFCRVVKITPPEATWRSCCKLSLSSAWVGDWRSKSEQMAKVLNNWSSKSFQDLNIAYAIASSVLFISRLSSILSSREERICAIAFCSRRGGNGTGTSRSVLRLIFCVTLPCNLLLNHCTQ